MTKLLLSWKSHIISKYLFKISLGVLTIFTLSSQCRIAAEDIQFPIDAGVINVKAAPYNAHGDGVTDDTVAIQNAIGDHLGKRGFLYFPNGTYKISNSLVWKQSGGNWWARLMIRGESRDGVVIQLANNASGFNDKAKPKAVIVTGSESPFSDGGNNQAFQNTIRNITINTGSGNAGAVGIDYVVSNQGSIKDVKIVAGDGNGSSGISMTRAYPGPGLIKNVEIQGFDYGIKLAVQDYSMTFSDVTLKSQAIAGLVDTSAMAHIYNLTSVNTVPAIQITGGSNGGTVLLIKGSLSGGTSANSAIIAGGRGLITRDLTVNGYGMAIDDQTSANYDVPMSGSPTTVAEYINPSTQSLFTSPAQTLRLPVLDAPEYTDDPPSNWASVQSYGATPKTGDSTAAIQSAMNSGKSTIWLGGEESYYYISGTITIPSTVKHIYGTNPWFVESGSYFDDASNPKPAFKLVGASTDPLIVEDVDLGLDSNGAIGFEHASTRTVVFRHCSLVSGFGQLAYTNSVTGGKLFGEDLVTSRLQINGPQQAWFRHLNTEYGTIPLVSANGTGAIMWIIGWKVENSPNQNVLTLTNGAIAEILGLYGYMNNYVDAIPMIVNNESSLAIQWWQAGSGGYRIPVRETRDGVTLDLVNHYQFQPFYAGYKTGAGGGGGGSGGTASATLTIDETIADQAQSATGPAYSNANLTTLGTTDWAIFGWNGSTPGQVNRKSAGTAIGQPTLTYGSGTGSSGFGRTNWTYTDGTSPASASGSALGGLGLQGNNSTDHGLSFSVAVAPNSSGFLYVWYAGFQGDHRLTAQVGSVSQTDDISVGYNNVTFKRVKIAYTTGSETSITVSLSCVARYSWNPTVTLYGVALASSAGSPPPSGTASATLTIDETIADQAQSATGPAYSNANLTTLGTTDWAIFGWNGSTPGQVNRKSAGTAIGQPTLTYGSGTGSSGFGRTNWTYTDGTSPASASGSALGGLGLQGNNSTDHGLSFSVAVAPNSSGFLYVWYAGFQGDHRLTAQVGSVSQTDDISVGYNNVTFKRVKIAYTTGSETSITVSLSCVARYSWNPTVTLYGVALSN